MTNIWHSIASRAVDHYRSGLNSLDNANSLREEFAAALADRATENCPTSRRTGTGDCGEGFIVGGVTHSCKMDDDHDGNHWCNCGPAERVQPESGEK